MNDQELDSIVKHAQAENPNIGIRMLQGRLQSLGHRIQRARINSSLRRTDPTGIMQRWQQTIKRRQYQVRCPLSLWHIDDNHKLIRYFIFHVIKIKKLNFRIETDCVISLFYSSYFSRWRIVIHGGIDGYSRIPVFLHASNNNKANTVLSRFLEATNEYGLPSRVRSDKGGENVDVASYMLSHPRRGPGRGSMITGKYIKMNGLFVSLGDYLLFCFRLLTYQAFSL